MGGGLPTVNAHDAFHINASSAGLVDNNRFINCSSTSYGYIFGRDDTSWGWAEAFGSAGSFVFFEDNEFSQNDPAGNHAIYMSYGYAAVIRCNKFTYTGSGRWYDAVDAHGYGHGTGRRGGRMWEIYGNYFDTKHSGRHIFLRAGSGRVYANRFANSASIELFEYRVCTTAAYAYPVTTNDYSTNSALSSGSTPSCIGSEGYPCCDQIGRIRDGGTRQIGDIAYFLDNRTSGGSDVLAITDGTAHNAFCVPNGIDETSYIRSGREYYNTQAPGYAPYQYPHPARGLAASTTCLSGENSKANTGITFFRTVP
ncbi:MAG: hypothetical protein JXB42_05800 [Deltaproteobacteria bacterium]|nr:hypothetical protein [Deltaproteobacteria bacterium]